MHNIHHWSLIPAYNNTYSNNKPPINDIQSEINYIHAIRFKIHICCSRDILSTTRAGHIGTSLPVWLYKKTNRSLRLTTCDPILIEIRATPASRSSWMFQCLVQITTVTNSELLLYIFILEENLVRLVYKFYITYYYWHFIDTLTHTLSCGNGIHCISIILMDLWRGPARKLSSTPLTHTSYKLAFCSYNSKP